MALAREINNILEKHLSVRFTKVARSKSLPERGNNNNKNNNIIVEFIGPSCIGKSTLYYQHVENHREDSEFNTTHGRKFRKHWKSYKKHGSSQLNKFHKQLLDNKINFKIKDNGGGIKKFESLKHFKLLLEIDAWIENHLNNTIVIFDEHIFGRLDNEQRPKDNDFDAFFKNRCFINCYAPPEFHFKNIMNRKKTGTNPIVYKDLKKREIFEKIKFEQQKSKDKVSYFRERNVPILEINTAKGPNQNCKLIDKFLTSIIKHGS